MTFPLEFDLLMIEVCTFKNEKKKEKKKKKNKKKKRKNKKAKKKTKKRDKKKRRKKRVQRYVCVSYLTPSIFFVVGFIIGGWGLSEIFMRDDVT